MDAENGIHATLKFHLPWRLIRGGSVEWLEARDLVLAELDTLMTALREGRLQEKTGG